jgi:parvulin-like peptidyl-prolyl isomerase
MLMHGNNISEEKKTFIFIFIHRITPKNMQDLIFFLQKNDFSLKRITKKNNKQTLTSIFVNSNFILESKQNVRSQQLKNLIVFLNQYSQLNGVFFNNQILNFERSVQLEKQSLFLL